jgi:hypothetical protein
LCWTPLVPWVTTLFFFFPFDVFAFHVSIP